MNVTFDQSTEKERIVEMMQNNKRKFNDNGYASQFRINS